MVQLYEKATLSAFYRHLLCTSHSLTLQLVLNWIKAANETLYWNKCIIKKSFLVTGLSNALGGHEDHLIRDDRVRQEIDEMITQHSVRMSKTISYNKLSSHMYT